MKKLILSLLTLITLATALFALPLAAYAVDVVDPSLCTEGTVNPDFVCKDKIEDKSTTNPLFGSDGIFTKVTSILSLIVAVIAVIVIVIAGIRYSLSQGDPQKLNNARNTIIYAIVALAVAGAAQGLVSLVLKRI